MIVLQAATTSSESLKSTFDDACRELPGADMIGYGEFARTMRRRRRENYPPLPTDPVEADIMRSYLYEDQGMVSSDDGDKELDEELEKDLFGEDDDETTWAIDMKICEI